MAATRVLLLLLSRSEIIPFPLISLHSSPIWLFRWLANSHTIPLGYILSHEAPPERGLYVYMIYFRHHSSPQRGVYIYNTLQTSYLAHLPNTDDFSCPHVLHVPEERNPTLLAGTPPAPFCRLKNTRKNLKTIVKAATTPTRK